MVAGAALSLRLLRRQLPPLWQRRRPSAFGRQASVAFRFCIAQVNLPWPIGKVVAGESTGWLAARCGASGAPLSALELYAHSRGRMRTFSRMYSVDPKACGSRSWLSCSGATGAEGGAGGAGTVGGASAVGVMGAVGAAGVEVR